MTDTISPIKSRILGLIESEKITAYAFEKRCGLSKGFVRSIITTIGVDKLQAILSAFPDINSTWLISGEGEMYIGKDDAERTHPSIIDDMRPTERLRKFAAWAQSQGLVKGESSFEKACGLSARYIANNLGQKRSGDMTTTTIARVYKKFPMLNLVWLCTGEGEMINPIQNTMMDYKAAYEGATQQITALNNIINTLSNCDTKLNPQN